jgi:benzoyl-CoA reductase/2-hydroxyglutaryl-CoA dehydratase subunit BcrC/BadD/HgdB
MKRETVEYNYDWMIGSIFNNGLKAFNGTPKEVAGFMQLLPSFKPVLDFLVGSEEVGRLFLVGVDKYMRSIMDAPKKGNKLLLGTFMLNQTIFDAFDGLTPYLVELITGFTQLGFRHGNNEFYDYCFEKGMTETSCAGQRATLGALMAGAMGSKPDVVVLGAAGPCDTNCNAAQFYAEYEGIPLVALDTPVGLTGERISDYQVRDVELMIEKVEKITGTRLNEDKLRELLKEKQVQIKLFNELFDLMTLVPNPVPAGWLLLVEVSGLIMPGKKEHTDLLKEMIRVCKKNAAAGRAGTYSGKEKARLYFWYIDHFVMDAAFHTWCMKNDISLLPTLVNSVWQEGVNYSEGLEDECYHIDTTDRKALIKTYADMNSRITMNKQLRGPYDAKGQWLSDVKVTAKVLKADYLVFCGTFGCRSGWSVNKLIEREMEKIGYPCMLLQGDAFDDRPASWDTLRRQMEEFMAVRTPRRRAA